MRTEDATAWDRGPTEIHRHIKAMSATRLAAPAATKSEVLDAVFPGCLVDPVEVSRAPADAVFMVASRGG